MTKEQMQEKGQAAFRKGIFRRENPYKYGTWQREAWDKGWCRDIEADTQKHREEMAGYENE